MDLSIFVAQVAAIIYLSVGIGMLLDKKYYAKFLDGFSKDTTAMYVGGFIALVAGFALVTFHNNWVKSWEVLVTIIGWLALIKGVMLLAFPTTFFNITKSWVNGKIITSYAFVAIVLGLVFGYFGFII
ncbi:hypothetical protein KJ657_04910 [Patescibacteria group bacterium]|nr:hypothetical protein [Patescibacteria group bacterium]MBU1016395.1 hypothetical protein [Patescibacteria group bacterium]MBU1685143.1 hypothetical protein [Patescibacteria group bacterium]MBU1938800.1 hypothetical protein [Patescibacteria group bacterium]